RRLRRRSLVGHDLHDVFAPQSLERLVAVLGAKLVDDSATMVLGAVRQRPKIRRLVIGNGQRVDGAGLGPLGADTRRSRATERRRVLAHKVFRPRRASQIDRKAASPESNPALASLTVKIPRTMFRKSASIPHMGLHPSFRPYTWPLQAEGAKLRAV